METKRPNSMPFQIWIQGAFFSKTIWLLFYRIWPTKPIKEFTVKLPLESVCQNGFDKLAANGNPRIPLYKVLLIPRMLLLQGRIFHETVSHFQWDIRKEGKVKKVIILCDMVVLSPLIKTLARSWPPPSKSFDWWVYIDGSKLLTRCWVSAHTLSLFMFATCIVYIV